MINSVDSIVPEMLRGIVAKSPQLTLLDGHRVVLRRDYQELRRSGTVALVSGGGSGHEPAHAGYVGPGMLTAAVVGEIFTSPSVDEVLATIRTVGGWGGVLLIVKNYTGDRLNFGLAAEIARAEGHEVAMVVVSDDVALAAEGPHAGRRGIAGTVLVHKTAGAAAARGDELTKVAAIAADVAGRVGTMGVALSACTVPAAGRPGFDLGEDEVEWGLGIHGEPGTERAGLPTAQDMADRIVSTIVKDKNIAEGDRVVLLVNNLGASPTSEIDVMTAATVAALLERRLMIERVWSGAFLTALDMAGCSISLLAVDDADMVLLDAPTGTQAWPAWESGRATAEIRTVVAPESIGASGHEEPPGTEFDGPLAARVRSVCDALLAAEDELTRLDSAVGDGDLGANLARGARAVLTELPGLPAEPARLLRAVASTVRRVVGGTSGPLYSVMLLRAAAVLEHNGADLSAPVWGDALTAAAAGVAELGGATVGDRTMLDALVPFAVTFNEALAVGTPDVEAARQALAAGSRGVSATADLVARTGRSSYLGERAKGTPDPGARAVQLWLTALAGHRDG